MVCSAAVLSSSLALSLLRHSSSPSQSFVLSPFSLNSALSIVHDGANGNTQKELTNLLLNGCTPADVTNHYSSLTLSLPSNNDTGVSFKSANRFYVDNSISLKNDYQKHVEDKYKVKVQGLKLGNKPEAAKEMNKFVEGATNGKIKDVMKPEGISDDAKAILINAIHFLGYWKYPFNPMSTNSYKFKGVAGEREMKFMNHFAKKFPVNNENEFGLALLLPYKDEQYRFFFLMPKETSNLDKVRKELTGEKLVHILKSSQDVYGDFTVPKFKIESKLDGVDVLKKLGVSNIFSNGADLSKVSDTPLKISKIQHNAVIETNELGTEAAASTMMEGVPMSLRPQFTIDRPSLYGILRNDDILFLGQLA
ncbi:hypothetical protein PFISCL1PPCAC_2063 [Pristionchus fissidentatus]|uniref:Serpin domain-containing protein n=1 Tax=Pristionchus fissidentatus TaxID=1538716 RepID=A0AAV5UUH8_9BILA|nr:hypothetical protein PFISCL1PPCAC_2063 [Pristionchus fissidentatus]